MTAEKRGIRGKNGKSLAAEKYGGQKTCKIRTRAARKLEDF